MKLMEEVVNSILWVNKEMVEAVYFPLLGKGPVIASNPQAGIELMKYRMNISSKRHAPIRK